MLPRRHRLSRRTFPDTRTGARAGTPHFTLWYRPAVLGGVAVIISKKVARRSVDRHLLKRRIMTLVRPYSTEKRAIVIYAKTGAPQLPYRALAEELGILFAPLKPYSL